MKPGNVFQLQIASAAARPRGLLMRLGLPLLLGLPLALADVPANAKVGGLVMLVLFVSFFGTAVATVRRRTDGRLTRLRLLPIPPALRWCDLVLADVAIDAAQMLPLGALFVAVNGRGVTAGGLVALAGSFLLAVVLLDALGALLAAAMKSNPEIHLFGALVVGAIAFVSGVFPAPQRVRPAIEWTAAFSPVAALSRSLERIVAGGPAVPAGWAAAAGGAVGLFAVAVVLRGWDVWPGARRRRGGDFPLENPAPAE